MHKIYYLIILLMSLIVGSTQASNILEIRVEEEKECKDHKNLQHLKEVEKNLGVQVICIFENVYYSTDGKKQIKQLSILPESTPSYTARPPSGSSSGRQPASRPRPSEPPKPTVTESKFVKIDTFFATDRVYKKNNDPNREFGNKILEGERAYQLGKATVTVPKSKRLGISSQAGMFTFNPDPAKHTMLKENKILSPEEFFKGINQNSQKQAFILIHGYNVSFSSVAAQTAELAYDLNFKGTPIFYSWPSKAKILGYFDDKVTVQNSQRKFAHFVNEFLQQAPQDLYLVAHSMGSVALLKTLKEELPRQALLQQHLKGIIFVAPDVPTNEFNQTIQQLSTYNIPVTLYGSQRDLALSLSKTISSYQRAGSLDPVDPLLDVQGLEVIDATNVRTDFLGHGLSPMAIDMSELIIHRTKANLRRQLQQMTHPKGTYFMLNR